MRQRHRLLARDESLQHIWPSFADVTSTFALVLFVLVLLAYVRNLVSSKQLTAYQDQIASAEKRLNSLSLDLSRTQREIRRGRAQLNASERKLTLQQSIIVASQEELATLRSRLTGIALLRVEVLDKVKRAIEAELGAQAPAAEGSLVRIGDNGNIVINEAVVFEFNSYALKESATPLLDTLARALEGVLDDPDVREYVDAIVVQGHTDERGASSFNRDLSAKRANAVLDYLFTANPNLEARYASFFASSAFSEYRPLDPGTNESAYERNRRIEISVVLKDANVRKLIDQYMENVQPAAPTPGGAPPPGASAAPEAPAPSPAP